MNTKFSYTRLDATTRSLMVEEITTATTAGELYFSTRFTPAGHQAWPGLLLIAAREHDEHRLAFEIESAGHMKHLEKRAKPSGGYTVAHVPDTAAETLADGQFTRFYIAAICRRAIEEGKKEVTVYRAKSRGEPRVESRALEGTVIDAAFLLSQVRSRQGSFSCELLKPNSGLSIH